MSRVADRLAAALAFRYRIERELGAGGVLLNWRPDVPAATGGWPAPR